MTDTTAGPPGSDEKTFMGHPRGLVTLFFTEMWERFSYYGLRPLLVLFMSAALLDGGFGLDRGQASAIVGIYAACVYLASLPGGWIADRWLGLRRGDRATTPGPARQARSGRVVVTGQNRALGQTVRQIKHL